MGPTPAMVAGVLKVTSVHQLQTGELAKTKG